MRKRYNNENVIVHGKGRKIIILKEQIFFGKLLMQLRKSRNVTLENLSLGLCTSSMLAKIEKGERYPDKLLRERLLERLGVAIDGFESYLNLTEYAGWKKRQEIFVEIEDGKLESAEKKLDVYSREKDMKKALEQQSVLIMKLQVMKHKHCTTIEQQTVLWEAIQLTIPKVWQEEPEKGCLSVQELNLLVEYNYCGNKDVTLYESVKNYLEQKTFDESSMAKLYPKLIYYMCCALYKESMQLSEMKKLLALCDKGLEFLKTGCHMFYLWELLSMKRQLLKKKLEFQNELSDEQRETWRKEQEETEEQERVITELYVQYQLEWKMRDDCYLYREPEVNCVADVIRVRRKMFGLSRKELCDGVCSLKTLERLEKRQANPQAEIIYQLFQRLGLSAATYRTEVVTEKQSDNELVKKLRRCVNEGKYELAECLLNQLEQSLDLELVVNRQFVERFSVMLSFYMKKIDKIQYAEKMKEVLEYTVPMHAVFSNDKLHLTNLEFGCLYNRTIALDFSDKTIEQSWQSLKRCYADDFQKNVSFSGYELVMTAYASYLGNKGEYANSSQISIEIIPECLQKRKMLVIASNLYNIFWNKSKCQKASFPASNQEKMSDILWNCIIISKLTGQTKGELFFKRKWLEFCSGSKNIG